MSNPYPARFVELLAASAGPVLDCGAGGRAHPRVVSLEIEAHPNNTVQADALDLPFRDGAFALVLSQAVLEHVLDPQRYVDEIFRVLRPGGLLWIEAAFLQPVHQAPVHYFNVTPFGLAHLCRRFEIIEQGAFGTLVEHWAWLARETDARRVVDRSDLATVARVLRRVDATLTAAQLWNVAPAVCLLGKKP